METIPFCYLIRWTKLNKSYYGVRYGEGVTPDTLWTSYHTSSQVVKEFIEENGDPDVVEVRKVFSDGMVARKWETTFLKRVNAVKSPLWLNANDTKNFYRAPGWSHTESTKRKISEVKLSKGRTITEEHKRAISEANKNKIVSKETRLKMSEARKKVKRTEEWSKNNGLAQRKSISIYSTLEDKVFTWDTTNTFKEETGFTNLNIKQMQSEDGLTIKRITKRVRHNFKLGDTLFFNVINPS